MSVQNVMMDIEAELMGFTLPLGAIFGAFVDIANAYTSIGSPYSKTYYFADTRERGRVTYFMDELAAYNGDPATLTQDMIDCYNVYDTSLPFYLKFRAAKAIAVEKGLCADCSEREFKTSLTEFVALCEENCPGEYALALTRTYDVITTLFQAAILTRPLDVTGLADGSADMGAIEDRLMADILDAANRTALASLEGKEFTDAEIDAMVASILSDPSVAAVASIGIRASIGNTFYSNPSRRGHEELAEAILLAWKGNISGRQAFIKAAVEAKQQIITMSVRYGVKAVYTLLDKVGEAFGIDEKTAGFFGLFVPDADDVIKLVIRSIGYGDADGMNRLLTIVQETAAELGAHSLKKVAAKEATILHAGNIEYYICPDCGRLFIDEAGMIPIADPDSVVIPRITLLSAIKSLFR